MDTIPPSTKKQIDRIIQIQQNLPHTDCFIQIFVEGHGWRFIELKTGKRYTPETYFKEFGEYPHLPHPEAYFSDEAIAARQRIAKEAFEQLKKKSKPKPQGFGVKTKPA